MRYRETKNTPVKVCFYLVTVDNNDTVSNSFIWFHSKNETIIQKVKLSFGTETMLISLSNWIYRTAKLKFVVLNTTILFSF